MHMPTGEIFNVDAELFEDNRLQSIADFDNERRLFNQKEKMVSLTESEATALKPLQPRQRKNFMRNKPCVCGSGKKFKKCCWGKFK